MLGSRRTLHAALGLLVALPAFAASFPPGLRFKTLLGARASVHFSKGLEPMARQASALADQILERHATRYGVGVPRVQIVLVDTNDDPNGFATPFPYPLVQIRAAAPDGSDAFGNHDGWLRLVLTHELAHIVHLEAARGALGIGRKLFGRAPILFPNTLTPTWMIEGLATYEETQGTAFGRGRNPDSRMVRRMAALEERFLREDQAVAGLDAWPAGQGSYLFGEAFLRDLSDRFGDGTLPSLARAHSGRLVPFQDERTSKQATGASFHERWREFAASQRADFLNEAGERSAAGLSASRPLTVRGVRQTGPRIQPNGDRVAYTSGSLTRFREIRVISLSGGGDRRVALRNGGTRLAWTPDGKRLVFDEPDVHGFFETRGDLRIVDVATQRVRRLTRGVRARDPDVAPNGETIVFVRRLGDRSELFQVGLDGRGLRHLTESPAGTEWSGPRFAPAGDKIAASRLAPGGFLDLVLVDPDTGAIDTLTLDRAKDVEPAWLPDGSGVVFRSDRDGVSNLYLLRLADRTLARITNVLGGAFTPEVAADGKTLVFANYSARGYDVHAIDFDPESLSPAAPFVDPSPEIAPPLPPSAAPVRAYHAYPTALPRFWFPYLAFDSEETRIGAVTAGSDPLLRHVYALEARYGTETRRAGGQAAYQLDRFFPTVLLTLEDTTDAAPERDVRRQELALEASFPVARSLRTSHSISVGWRRRRDSVVRGEPRAENLGGIEAAYSLASAKRYSFSISPTDGGRFRVAYLQEAPSLGSDVSLGKLSADARAYLRLGSNGVLALRAGGGRSFGSPDFRRSFAVGGFPDGALSDVVRSNLTVLRGYPDDAFSGRSYVSGNAELRLPLGHPQRGIRSLPLFLRHLHLAAFVDAGDAWSGAWRASALKAAAGIALGADLNLAHAVPSTFTAGVAYGFADKGETRAYFRAGLSF